MHVDHASLLSMVLFIGILLVASVSAQPATDNLSSPDSQTVVTQENLPPKLTDLSPDKSDAQAGQSVTWTAKANDPELSDKLLFKFWLAGPSTNGRMLDKTGWVSDSSWTWTTTSDDVGDNQIEVWVRDGNHAGDDGFDAKLSRTFTINPVPSEEPEKIPSGIPAQEPQVPAPTTPTPEPIVNNMPPVLSGFTPDRTSVEAGSKVTLTAVATDKENDPLMYKFFLKGPATGGQLVEQTEWIPENKWTWTTKPEDAGTNQVEVWVRDGNHAGTNGKDDSAASSITVTLPNQKPSIASITPDKFSIEAGSQVAWTVQASDPENDPLLYKFFLKGPGTGNKLEEKTEWTSENKWTWTTKPEDAGTNQVEVWVRDGNHAGTNGKDDSAASSIAVTLPNQKPSITSFAPDKSGVEAGSKVTWAVQASDPENDPLLYKFFLKGPGTGGKLAGKTDWISDNTWDWTTTPDDVGSNQVEVWVRDGKHAKEDGFDDNNVVSYVVTKPAPKPEVNKTPAESAQSPSNLVYSPAVANKPPAINSFDPNKTSPGVAGDVVRWTATASDPDNDPLLFKFFLKGPATGNNWKDQTQWESSNTWIWAIASKDVGDNQIRVWVRDGNHANAEGSDDNATVDYTINSKVAKPLSNAGSKNEITTNPPEINETKPPAINNTKPPSTNATPEVNVTPAKKVQVAINKTPVLNSFLPDRSSPQFAGTAIIWTATASDPDNDSLVFRFFLKGPATDDQWKDQTQWIPGNTWTWTTSAKDVGSNQVRVWVRDQMHANPEGSDDNATVDYTINATVSPPLPKPEQKNETETKPLVINETKPPITNETVPSVSNQTKPAPANETPAINATQGKPEGTPNETVNLQPVVNGISSDKQSPQVPGTSITWTANASDPEKDKILYKFFRNGPSTGGSWKPETDWSQTDSWTWSTSQSDVGSNQIRVWVRDGNHAKDDAFDGEQTAWFTIKETSANISGIVFEDKQGKPGLSGWTVKLTKPDASEVSTLTRQEGSYKFENLVQGAYTVSEVPKAGWSASSPAEGAQKVSLSGSDKNDVSFGNKAITFSISGKKFNDLNNNGVNDGEPGLSGWTINLEQPAGKVISTTTTAADGTYKFGNLTPGDYVLTEVAQKGWTETAPSSKSYSVSLVDADVTGKDFGNNAGTWSISGTVFQDLNGNKTGLSGWKVQLSQNNNILNVTDTAADGSYVFRNLAAGAYTVSEVAQNGWVQTIPSGGSYSIALKDADVSGKDFVNRGNLTISGVKYYDLNGNGIQDKDEPGIPGQTVALLENGKQIATATTGQDGVYTFNNLVQGTYTINDPPSGGFVLTTTSSVTVTVTTSGVINANFGLTGTHSISGAKFNDVNNNGVMDSGEGVPGWGIMLDGTTTFHGIHITRTVNTGSDGSYVFDHLAPGTYKISELSRPGWTQTVPSGAGSYTVNLGGSDVVGKNFGNRVVNAPGTASIWGMKFNDLNNNGVNDGDPGLQGWTVQLKNATNHSIIKTTTTNAQGWYSFTNLAPGSYIVSESAQPTWDRTLPGGSGEYSLTLSSGESKTGIDFGNYNSPPINPTLTPSPSSSQKVGTVVTWTATATDPKSDPLKFRFILKDQHGNVLSDTGYKNNNVWTWYTGSLGGQPGTYQVEVRITDSKHPPSSDARATVSYELTRANRPPEIDFLYSDRPAAQFSGSWIKWTAVAHDPDGDPILYRYFLRGPSTGGFWADMTGWTRNPKWIWRTSPLDVGTSEILVIVRDGKHAGPNGWDDFAIASYTIVGLNQPPAITGIGTSTLSPQQAGTMVKWSAKAVDPNGDPIFYRYWLKGPSTEGFWRMVRDWSTDNTWTWITSQADAGTSQVDVQVRDGLHSGPDGFDDDAAMLFTIMPPDLPPQLTGLSSDKQSPIAGGLTVRWTATARDSDGDPTLYRFWLKGPSTGNNWKIVQDWSYSNVWTWATTPVDAGDYTVYAYARDGKHAGPNGFDSALGSTLKVLPSNKPPQVKSLNPDLPSSQYAGTPIRWTAIASDPEPEPILYKFLLKGPSTGNNWKTVQDWSYNNIWVWADKPNEAGNYTVYVYARDEWNAGPNGYDSSFGRTFSLSNPAMVKKMTSGAALKDRPSLTNTGNGYLLAYQSLDLGNSNNGDIFLQKLDKILTSTGSAWATNDAAYQNVPSVIFSDGKYYVAYVSNETGNLNIFLKVFDSNLKLIDAKQLTDSPVDQDSPSLIQVGDEFYLAYQSWDTGSDNGGDIFISRFDHDWNLINRVQATDLASYQDHPSITFDGLNFDVAYASKETGSLEIFVKRFDENLNYLDTRQITSDKADQDYPSLNYTNGMFNLLYSTKKGSNYDVYLNRFDGTWKTIDSTNAVTASGDMTSASYSYSPADGLYWLAYVSKDVEGQNIYIKSLKLPGPKA